MKMITNQQEWSRLPLEIETLHQARLGDPSVLPRTCPAQACYRQMLSQSHRYPRSCTLAFPMQTHAD